MNNSLATLSIDIGSSAIDAVIASLDHNNHVNILGSGSADSKGLEKGEITNIELAGQAIGEAVANAQQSSGVNLSNAIVSISSSYTKIIRSNASIMISNGLIGENEIKNVLDMALYNARTVSEYSIIHILPIYFKVDESKCSTPLNINGSRLEVEVSIITAKKTALINIENALKISGLEVKNYVLSGYGSSIAILKDEEKKFGTFIIDLGGNTTDITLVKDQAVLYNNFIPYGSEAISNDISQTFNTPRLAADMIKHQYATLEPIDTDVNQKRIKFPIIGNDNDSNELAFDQIQPVIHARVEEILVFAHEMIQKSELVNYARAGILLTGGMSKLPGIQSLATKVFRDMNVKIASNNSIPNRYIDFSDNTKSTVAGLVLYSLNQLSTYELDSNGTLKTKVLVNTKVKEPLNNQTIQAIENENISYNTNTDILTPLKPTKKSGFFSKMVDDMKEWF